jgi:hypothetical protein
MVLTPDNAQMSPYFSALYHACSAAGARGLQLLQALSRLFLIHRMTILKEVFLISDYESYAQAFTLDEILDPLDSSVHTHVVRMIRTHFPGTSCIVLSHHEHDPLAHVPEEKPWYDRRISL